jgi:hypothetical protein
MFSSNQYKHQHQHQHKHQYSQYFETTDGWGQFIVLDDASVNNMNKTSKALLEKASKALLEKASKALLEKARKTSANNDVKLEINEDYDNYDTQEKDDEPYMLFGLNVRVSFVIIACVVAVFLI